MIYYEGRLIKPDEVIYPDDTPFMKEQRLEIAYILTKEGKKRKICELSFFNTKTQKQDSRRPRGGNKEKLLQKIVDKFIKKIKNGEFSIEKPIKKTGTKSNMNFVYGENIEKKDKIIQAAVDFNGTRKVVKEICLV